MNSTKKFRIYIACAYEQRRRAREWMQYLRARGYEISFDWTAEDQRVKYWREDEIENLIALRMAQRDVEGVATADVILVLTTAKGGRGMYTEFGIALALNKKILIVGRHLNNLFYYSAKCERGLVTKKQVLTRLNRLRKVKALFA